MVLIIIIIIIIIFIAYKLFFGQNALNLPLFKYISAKAFEQDLSWYAKNKLYKLDDGYSSKTSNKDKFHDNIDKLYDILYTSKPCHYEPCNYLAKNLSEKYYKNVQKIGDNFNTDSSISYLINNDLYINITNEIVKEFANLTAGFDKIKYYKNISKYLTKVNIPGLDVFNNKLDLPTNYPFYLIYIAEYQKRIDEFLRNYDIYSEEFMVFLCNLFSQLNQNKNF